MVLRTGERDNEFSMLASQVSMYRYLTIILFYICYNRCNMDSVKLTTIAVTRENYQVLKELGRTGDSFNDVLTRILKERSKS